MVGYPEGIQIVSCGLVPRSRLLVINRTTDDKGVYRYRSEQVNA
jgi:hypothetical protein